MAPLDNACTHCPKPPPGLLIGSAGFAQIARVDHTSELEKAAAESTKAPLGNGIGQVFPVFDVSADNVIVSTACFVAHLIRLTEYFFPPRAEVSLTAG